MSQQETEYEWQFWRFCAKEISTGLKDATTDSLETIASKMFKAIRQRKSHGILTVLPKNCQIWLNEVALNSGEQVFHFEKYILETFSIPNHILLNEDCLQRQQYTNEEREGLEKELEQIWKEINRVHFLETHLSQELENHRQMESISQRLKTLDMPPMDSLPNPKNVHHPIFDTLGLEVEEANCRLKNEEETEESNNLDFRDVLTLLFARKKGLV